MYSTTERGGVRAVLGEANPSLRAGIRAVLYARGIRGLEICKDAVSLLSYLDSAPVDLVVCDLDLPGGDLCGIIQQVRQKTLGRNPFTVIIVTVSDSSLAEIRRVINAGADHVVRKPMPMSQIAEAVESLLKSRRPFVASEDYMGPTRRLQGRPDNGAPAPLKAPNTLRDRMVDGADDGRVTRTIDENFALLREMKAENSAHAIQRLAERVCAAYEERDSADGIPRDLRYLTEKVEELERRHRGTETAHLAELASGMGAVVRLFAADPASPPPSYRKLLAQLGEVAGQALRDTGNSVDLVREIAGMVRGTFSDPRASAT